MDFSNLTPERIITVIVCGAVVIGYLVFKWRRASNYVDACGAQHAEWRQKQIAYTQRAKTDPRWNGFLNEILKSCRVSESETDDKETYQLYYINIMDQMQKQYEANEPGSENASIYVFLKRKANPKYLQFERTAAGEIIQRKISGGQWYDMFDKAV